MKRSIFLLLILFQALSAQAQILRGTVFDRATGAPIPYVAVYLDGTSIYTHTDSEGNFQLNARNFVNTRLVLSLLGYHMLTFENPFAGLPERIGMEEKQNTLGEVIVRPTPFSRQEMLRFFRRNFLGITRAGASCVIENEDDILFGFDWQQKILRASSDTPLRIKNRYLGYDILFNLLDFQSQLVSTQNLYTGNEMTLIQGSSTYIDRQERKSRFLKRRNAAYESSMNAFMRALSCLSLEGTDFQVFQNDSLFTIDNLPLTVNDNPPYKTVSIHTEATPVRINRNFQANVFLVLSLRNKKAWSGLAPVYFLSNEYNVDPYGNIDRGGDIITTGTMGEKRVGDLLPLDFESQPD